MKTTLKNRIGIDNSIIQSDECLVLYKSGSRGEVIGIYDCIDDVCVINRFLVKLPQHIRSRIRNALIGKSKSFKSPYHNCMCVPRIEKRSKHETRN